MKYEKNTYLLNPFLAGCVSVPENIRPVDNFSLERYLGKWYEIARLDHSFKHGLTFVNAEYSLRPDGGVRVINKGYSQKEKKWKEIEGRGYFVDRKDVGFLKVSFFGPFSVRMWFSIWTVIIILMPLFVVRINFIYGFCRAVREWMIA